MAHGRDVDVERDLYARSQADWDVWWSNIMLAYRSSGTALDEAQRFKMRMAFHAGYEFGRIGDQ